MNSIDNRIMDFIFDQNEELKERVKDLKEEIKALNQIIEQYRNKVENNLIGD
jgi:prefoldin subunit 5